jgi:hypothetical protein
MTEFHAPQLSQRPAHFLWAAPQEVQVKTEDDFAMRLDAMPSRATQVDRHPTAFAF